MWRLMFTQAVLVDIPPLLLLAILVTQFAQAIAVNLIFSVLAYMTRFYLGDGVHDSEVSEKAGFLAALYFIGMAISNPVWGRVSERIGRRPCLLVGNVSSIVAAVLIGISTSYSLTCAVRLISGFLNPITLTVKTVIAEIDPEKKHTARLMSLLSLSFNLGMIVGPSSGGVLAFPCGTKGHETTTGLLCSHAFVRERPFLFPFLFMALWNVIALACQVAFLPETKGMLVSHSSSSDGGGGGHGDEQDDDDEEDDRDIELAPLVKASAPEPESTSEDSTEEERLPKRLYPVSSRGLIIPPPSPDSDDDDDDDDRHTPVSSGIPWQTRRIWAPIVTYGLLALGFTLLDESFPLMAAAELENGGLKIQSKVVGAILATGAVSTLAFTFFAYPALVRAFGRLRIFRWGLALTALTSACFPMPTLFVGHFSGDGELHHVPSGVFWPIMIVLMAMKNAAGVTAFTSSAIICNNSAPPGHLATVNGVGQSAASLARAIGPAMAGLSWSLAIRLQTALPGLAQFLPFSMYAFLACVALWVCTFIPADLESKK